MARGASLSVATAVVLLLAGCVGNADTASKGTPQPPSVISDQGGTREDAATIRGLVVDDAESPIEGALVGLVEARLQAATDAGGSFAFTNLAPGTYTVAASALGFDAGTRRVTVEAEAEERVVFRLVPIRIEDVYQEVNGPFDGFFTCKLGTPTQTAACGSVLLISFRTDDLLWANDKAFQWFNMTADNYRTFIGELDWRQGTFATSTKLRTSFSHERFGGHWFCSAEGKAPLYFRFGKVDPEEAPTCEGGTQGGTRNPVEPSKKQPLVVGFRVPFGTTSGSPPEPVYLAFQQRVTSFISVFYGEPAPEGWAALKDS